MANSNVTLEDFYKHVLNGVPEGFTADGAHVNIMRLEKGRRKVHAAPAKPARRDFYKISLLEGHSLIHYADRSIETKGSTLTFFNPLVPFTWEPLDSDCTGVNCLFNEAFFAEKLHTSLRALPMFTPGNKPSYELDEAQRAELERIFAKMESELLSDYRLKYELIRNYIVEILHFALKMEPSEMLYKHSNANARITSVFLELLERQFPIEAPDRQASLRSPADFAARLAVHVNHLNRAIKETTGKTTSDLIAERVVNEAKALLKHTSWNISEIGYSLGFEGPGALR